MSTSSKSTGLGCLLKGGLGCLSSIGVSVIAMLIVALVMDDSKKPDPAGDAGRGETPQVQVGGASRPAPSAGGNVKVQLDEKPPTVEEALAELDALVGLESVKAEVKKLASVVKVNEERRKAGLKTASLSYHMVFTGNPGTGKTTVARIIAKVFRALGILKKGHLVETDRSGLVGAYVGETAIKTGKLIDEALDGVLFVDEAYALAGEGKDYGNEAIATLLKRMEDDRSRLVVVVAGYTEEMKKFIDANSGLKSRFNRYIEFPDYSPSELAEMFRRTAKKNQYALSADLEKYLDAALRVWTKKRDRKFGNGRYVRNLFEKSVERQALRISNLKSPTPEQLTTLTLKDVGISLKDPNASQED